MHIRSHEYTQSSHAHTRTPYSLSAFPYLSHTQIYTHNDTTLARPRRLPTELRRPRQHRQAKEEMLLQMLPSQKRRKQQLLPLMTRRRSLQQRRAGPSMPQSVPKGRLRPNPRWRRWCRILFRIAANCSLLVEFSFDSSKLLAAAL